MPDLGARGKSMYTLRTDAKMSANVARVYQTIARRSLIDGYLQLQYMQLQERYVTPSECFGFLHKYKMFRIFFLECITHKQLNVFMFLLNTALNPFMHQ